MKKSIKCGIAAAMVVAAGFAAYQTYGAYGAQDNSLLMQKLRHWLEMQMGKEMLVVMVGQISHVKEVR